MFGPAQTTVAYDCQISLGGLFTRAPIFHRQRNSRRLMRAATDNSDRDTQLYRQRSCDRDRSDPQKKVSVIKFIYLYLSETNGGVFCADVLEFAFIFCSVEAAQRIRAQKVYIPRFG